MLPPFEPATGYLPPGVHEATWEEIVARYGITSHRLELLAGLKAALNSLRAAGCRRAYVDGSFVSAKDTPGDFDACWEAAHVNPDLLDPVLLDLSKRRAAQKAKYGGELFPANSIADGRSGIRFSEFFQRDRNANPKGIVALDLASLP